MCGLGEEPITTALLRGTLEYCVLALLAERELYSTELLRRISDELQLAASEGAMYPLLSRLRNSGRIAGGELVRDLREHIETSRADLPAETEAQVRGILERLGDPGGIARAAAEETGLPLGDRQAPKPRRGLRIVAVVVGVVVLLVGALFLVQDNRGGSVPELPHSSGGWLTPG